MSITFGEYIRKLRMSKQLTLTQLAAKIDMDSANLSKIENGKREFDIRKLQKLANVFDLELSSLKEEYLSDKFAKTIYQTSCSIQVLKLAEEKVNYLLTKKNLLK